MTKRKKIILFSAAIVAVTAVGVTIPMLINGEDSSQSSTSDTSSTEVSVSVNTSFSDSTDSIREEISDEASAENSNKEVNNEISNEISGESAESDSNISQTSDSMSETNSSSSPETPTPLELTGLGVHSLSIPSQQGTDGVLYAFTAEETGYYGISSQSISKSEERFALIYTLNKTSGYLTDEKQTLELKKGDVLFFTAYVYDASLFVYSDPFQMDVTLTRQLVVGDNTLSCLGECVVYFLPSAHGEYLFTASEGVRIFCFSYVIFRYEEITAPLTLTAGTEIRLIFYSESEEPVTVTITKK